MSCELTYEIVNISKGERIPAEIFEAANSVSGKISLLRGWIAGKIDTEDHLEKLKREHLYSLGSEKKSSIYRNKLARQKLEEIGYVIGFNKQPLSHIFSGASIPNK